MPVTRRVVAALLVVALAGLPPAARAMFLNLSEPVPIDRLVENLQRHVEANPEVAAGFYTLGRVHSLAYAQLAFDGQGADGSVTVIPADKRGERRDNAELPAFPPYGSVQVGAEAEGGPARSDRAERHLRSSLENYRKAVALAPDNALYQLGLGWMSEQAMRYGLAGADYRAAAIGAYRRAFDLRHDEELRRMNLAGVEESVVATEAGTNLVRLLKVEGVSPEEQATIDRVEATLAQLRRRPQAVTPIVFSLDADASPDDLIDADASVRFDLAALGGSDDWPWVTPRAWLLAWDPARSGDVRGGSQLVGSRTWSMFWSDGYEALAALDDDGDGMLRGEELAGLAGWRDADGDAISDAGEVRPIGELGIVAIRVAGESHGRNDVIAWQPAGLVLDDGRELPTWDWTPSPR